MLNVLLMTTVLFIISSALMMIASTISKKSSTDREKSSPFECGFDPKASARLPFSLQFFLIAVIFLIFDVEIAILLPFTIIMQTSPIYCWSSIGAAFLTILLLGLYHEWNQGALEWAQ
uniref:NADH-ubiquinone oxidoreductase chain 3 n=1 Tax=Parajapyx emeryanus TaxID=165473 RepID=U3KTP2_9HEXA|nr:NADH dehydrogenase subunit 3 [Parajapyx emeryanus]AEV44853.1 NADH dehydrogenase subunit 3 [Parajapyx emeryanus]